MSMNSATFRTIREFVGLTAEDVADHCGVAVRTVNRWEEPEGHWLPAEEAVRYVQSAMDYFNETAEIMLEFLDEQEKRSGPPQNINLSRYVSHESYQFAGNNEWPWPLGVHSRLQGYLLALLIEEHPVVVEWIASEL